MLYAVSLGLFAAFLFAASASVQQRAAYRTDYAREALGDGSVKNRPAVIQALVRLVRRLVRTPLWLIGWGVNLIGFLVQAWALHVGSVALVQPLLVTQLLFALPMASAARRRWPGRRDWLSAIAISGGLAIFLAVRGVAPMVEEPDRGRVVLGGLAAAGAVGLLVAASAGRRPTVHAAFVAVAAGLCFAMSAALIKLTTEDLIYRGVGETARDWPGYALAVCTFTGLVLEQGAFAAGSLPAAVAAMSIANPIASYMLGVFAFHAPAPTGAGALAALAGAGALICVGAIGLAHAPIVRPESRRERRRSIGAPATGLPATNLE